MRVVLERKLVLSSGFTHFTLSSFPTGANLSHMVLAFLHLQLSLRPSSSHHGFPFISLARYLPPTGWFVEVAKCWELSFLSWLPQCPLPSSWQQRAARCLIALSDLTSFVSPYMICFISEFIDLVCISNKWENRIHVTMMHICMMHLSIRHHIYQFFTQAHV